MVECQSLAKDCGPSVVHIKQKGRVSFSICTP